MGLAFYGPAAAEEDKDAADLAKASQNPVSSLISVPFELNVNFNSGPDNKTNYILNVKPVYPLGLTENWNLINRLIVPVKYLSEQNFDIPLPTGQDLPVTIDSEFGLGDITYQGFLSPAKPGKLIWGAGPMLVMPTGTDDRLGSDKWAAGPSVVALMMPGSWVVGGLVSNIWSFAGDSDAGDINLFSFQYFINYNMKGGWYFSISPTITANWEASSDNTWTVPVGGGFGRVFKIGRQPVNAKVAGYYNAVRPDHASDWTFQTTITFMFPK
jgi:hypothetical protein